MSQVIQVHCTNQVLGSANSSLVTEKLTKPLLSHTLLCEEPAATYCFEIKKILESYSAIVSIVISVNKW